MNRKIMRGIKRLKVNRLLLPLISVGKEYENKGYDLSVLWRFSPSPNTSAVLEKERNGDKKFQFHLSIIVPVFQVENYIRQCILSLLSQETAYRYQIIIVNDGTPDKSIEKIEDLLSDERILLVNQENRGFSGARNTGLDHMNSEYVTFVDSDDYVPPNMVENLLRAADTYGADIVVGGYCYYYEKSGKTKKISPPTGEVANCYDVYGLTAGKAFRTELFSRIEFPLGYWFEDTIMKHLVYPRAKSIYGIADSVYIYRLRDGSISSNFYGKPKCLDSTWITWQMLADRKKLGLSRDDRYLACFLKQLALNYQRENALGKELKKQVFYWMAELVREEFAQCTGQYLTDETRKLYKALLNYDYRAYCRLCLCL